MGTQPSTPSSNDRANIYNHPKTGKPATQDCQKADGSRKTGPRNQGPDSEKINLAPLISGSLGRMCRHSYRRHAAHITFMSYIRGIGRLRASDLATSHEDGGRWWAPRLLAYARDSLRGLRSRIVSSASRLCRDPSRLRAEFMLAKMKVGGAASMLAILTFLALLLVMQGVEPNPGPKRKRGTKNEEDRKTSLKVVSWNCDSLSNPERQRRAAAWAHNAKVDVLLLQETRIENDKNLLTKEVGEYTFYCSPCSGTKYGVAIGVHNTISERVVGARGHNDRLVEIFMMEPGYPERGASPAIIRIQSIYGPQDYQRTPQGERERKKFWNDVNEHIQEKISGHRVLTIVGADCNGRLATSQGSPEIGPECLHKEFTHNGHSVLELMINNRMRAVNTFKASGQPEGSSPPGTSEQARAKNLATFTTASAAHQIDYILASKAMPILKCELAKDLRFREDVKAGHTPIMCELEYRTLPSKRSDREGPNQDESLRPRKGPMDLEYCPQKLRQGIHKWRSAAAVKESGRTTQQTHDLENMNAYIKAIKAAREACPAQHSWEQALQDIEKISARFFPRKTAREAKLEKAIVQGEACQKSQKTAGIEDQIDRKTGELLETRKQLTKEVAREALKQWAARCKAVRGAEWRLDSHNKCEWHVEYEDESTGARRTGWVRDSELKWVPEDTSRLAAARSKVLQRGWTIKAERQRLRSDLKRSERQDRANYYDNLCKHIEEGDTFHEKLNRTWQLVKRLNGKNKNTRSSKLSSINSDSGPQILPQDKAHAFGEFLVKSFTEDSQNMLSSEEWGMVQERTMDSLPQEATLQSISKETREMLESPISKEEIERAIKELKKGKAISTDHLCSEILTLDPAGWAEWLLPVINNMDPSTQSGRVIFLYKGKGSTADRANYRPISILSPMYKIWTSVQTKRCNAIVDDIASCWQFGFRRNRGCREALYSMQALISRSAHKDLSLAMLDLSKAFDKANRKILFKKMVEYGAPKSFVDQVRKGHSETKLTACFEGKYSDPVQIQKGVYQGSPLSPVLYVLYAHSIFLDFQQEAERQGLQQVELTSEPTDDSEYLKLKEDQAPKLGDHKIPMICYADDTTLVAPDMDTLGKAIVIFNEVLGRYHMQCNKGKTKILTREKLTSEQKYMFAESVLQVSDRDKVPDIFVENAKFLGSLVNIQGYSHQACVERANEGRKLWQALGYSFFRNEHVSRENKMRVYNAVFGSVLLYGVDAYNYSENDIQEIQTLQNKILRGIYEGKIPPPAEQDANYFQNRVNNRVIQSELGAPAAKSLVERARLRFWGSLSRGGKLLNGAVLIHKLQLDEETSPAVKIQRRRQLKEQFDTRQKQIDILMSAFNDRYSEIREEVEKSVETEKTRWHHERYEADGYENNTRQDWDDVKAIIHLEEKEYLQETLYSEHHCTRSVARTAENIKTIFANVRHITAATPASMSERLWKRLTNWVVTTQACDPADETAQIKHECEGCKREFRCLFTHFQHVAAARRQEGACLENDCVQHYISAKDPKIPLSTAELAEEDNDVEMDVNWRTHPHRFTCPMGLKSCTYPALRTRWCIICQEREGYVPHANISEKRNKEVRNRKAREVKACTGKALVPHSGKVELECPKKMKTCKYPDLQGWWCKNCVGRSGVKPPANIEREDQARERKRRNAAVSTDNVDEDGEQPKKKHKDANGQAVLGGAQTGGRSLKKRQRQQPDTNKRAGKAEGDGTPKPASQPATSTLDSAGHSCPNGVKSCKYPNPKGYWCARCMRPNCSEASGAARQDGPQRNKKKSKPKEQQNMLACDKDNIGHNQSNKRLRPASPQAAGPRGTASSSKRLNHRYVEMKVKTAESDSPLVTNETSEQRVASAKTQKRVAQSLSPLDDNEHSCPKGVKSCKYPKPNGYWCAQCKRNCSRPSGKAPRHGSQENKEQVEQQKVPISVKDSARPIGPKKRQRPESPPPVFARSTRSSKRLSHQRTQVRVEAAKSIPPPTDLTSPSRGKRSYEDLHKVGGANSRHRILGRSSQHRHATPKREAKQQTGTGAQSTSRM